MGTLTHSKRPVFRGWTCAVVALSAVGFFGCGGKNDAGGSCSTQDDCKDGMDCLNSVCHLPGTPRPVSAAQKGSGDPKTWEVFRVARDKKDPVLNMREGRKKRSKLIAKLSEGTGVEILETKGKWRSIKVTEGEHAGKTGWAHMCCLKPRGSRDLYWARLSFQDHHNNSGKALQTGVGVIRQDRANYHAYKKRDKEDRDDDLYDKKSERKMLSDTLKASLDDKTKRIMLKREPLIEVITYSDRIDVNIIEEGDKHQMSYDEAYNLCDRRYCKCNYDKGKCKHKKFASCMKVRGFPGNNDCSGSGH